MFLQSIALLKTLGILNIVGVIAIISSPVVAFVFWQNSNMRKEFENSFVTKDEYDKDVKNAKVNIIKPISDEVNSIKDDLKELTKIIGDLGKKIERLDATTEAYIKQKDNK